MSAIRDTFKVASKQGIPVIADGGIKFSGDIVKALAAGAHTVMVGDSSRGRLKVRGNRSFPGRSYKVYRGMGSLEAKKEGSRDRYFQDEMESPLKLVPEGIEGRVPFRGFLSDSIYQMVGGIRSGMGYVGCPTIQDMHDKVGLSASHPRGSGRATSTTSSSRRKRPTTGWTEHRSGRHRRPPSRILCPPILSIFMFIPSTAFWTVHPPGGSLPEGERV
jgi:IMP dehydrogenase/GMP reductase